MSRCYSQSSTCPELHCRFCRRSRAIKSVLNVSRRSTLRRFLSGLHCSSLFASAMF